MPETTKSRSELGFLREFGAETLDVAVERAAQSLVGRESVPVNLHGIARNKGYRIRLRPRAGGCPEGRLIPAGASFVIELLRDAPANRRRFSLGHELGHTFFYRLGPTGQVRKLDICTRTEYEAEERICDLIAMAMLLPRSQVCQFFLSRPRDSAANVLRTLEQTARAFRSSNEALACRLSQVAAEAVDAAVLFLCFRKGPKPNSEPKLRVEGCYRFGAMRDVFVPKNIGVRQGLNLKSPAELFQKWQAARATLERGGRFIVDDGILVCSRSDATEYNEEMNASRLSSRERRVPVRTASCLYDPRLEEQDCYILSVVMPL